jgi:tellurite resistance protein
MAELLERHGGLEPERAQLVAEMAAHRNELLGPSEDYLATREFRRVAGPGDAESLLHCLFAVTAADDSISLREEEEIRQIATELGIEHAGFTAVRALFREKRAVLRDPGRAG